MSNDNDTEKLAIYLACLLDPYCIFKQSITTDLLVPDVKFVVMNHEEVYETVLKMLNNYPDKIVLVEN